MYKFYFALSAANEDTKRNKSK